jgi:hypothetical protein
VICCYTKCCVWQVSPANMMVNLCQQQNSRVVITDPDSALLRKANVMLYGPAGTILPHVSGMAFHLRYVSISWVSLLPHPLHNSQSIPSPEVIMWTLKTIIKLSQWGPCRITKANKTLRFPSFLTSCLETHIMFLDSDLCSRGSKEGCNTSKSGGSLLQVGLVSTFEHTSL